MPDDKQGLDEAKTSVKRIKVVEAEEIEEAPASHDEVAAADDAETIEETAVRDQVGLLESELEDLRELYLRKLAEFDNFRKRTEREREELIRTAGENLVRDLVPVLDNFERALSHASDSDPESLRQGVEMINKQLRDVLQRQGLVTMDPVGEEFEPEYHEAVQRIEGSDAAPGTVAWVAAKGYILGGRLIRPAMVGVAVEPAEPSGGRANVAQADEGDNSP